MKNQSLTNEVEKPIKLTGNQFGIRSDGTIKFMKKQTKLVFKRGQVNGKDVVIMKLSAIIDNELSNIVIGPTEDTGFKTIGRFDFSTESSPEDIFESLSLFIDDGENPDVRLVSASSDFDMLTDGVKIEHGHSVSGATEKGE